MELSEKAFDVDQAIAGNIPRGDDRYLFDATVLENVIKAPYRGENLWQLNTFQSRQLQLLENANAKSLYNTEKYRSEDIRLNSILQDDTSYGISVDIKGSSIAGRNWDAGTIDRGHRNIIHQIDRIVDRMMIGRKGH